MKSVYLGTALVLILCLSQTTAIATGEPALMVSEPTLGSWPFTGILGPTVDATAAPGAVLVFSWSATPGDCATILDYRYGWDLLDPNDDADPGWSSWGSLLSAPPRSFSVGVHTFTAEVEDTCGGVSRGTIRITIEEPVSTETSTWGAIKALYR